MAKDLMQTMQTAVLDSQFLSTIRPYVALVVLAVMSLQFLRLVILTVFTILRLLVRVVLLVISWPIYLILLPARAAIYLTKLTMKLTLYVAVAAIVYQLLGGAVNIGMMQYEFDQAIHYTAAYMKPFDGTYSFIGLNSR